MKPFWLLKISIMDVVNGFEHRWNSLRKVKFSKTFSWNLTDPCCWARSYQLHGGPSTGQPVEYSCVTWHVEIWHIERRLQLNQSCHRIVQLEFENVKCIFGSSTRYTVGATSQERSTKPTRAIKYRLTFWPLAWWSNPSPSPSTTPTWDRSCSSNMSIACTSAWGDITAHWIGHSPSLFFVSSLVPWLRRSSIQLTWGAWKWENGFGVVLVWLGRFGLHKSLYTANKNISYKQRLQKRWQ